MHVRHNSKILEIRTDENGEQYYALTQDDLPLACPARGTKIWNKHPRVSLPIEATGGRATCPYCNTLYVIEDE